MELTNSDLPTVVICFDHEGKLVYGVDMRFSYSLDNTAEFVELRKGDNFFNHQGATNVTFNLMRMLVQKYKMIRHCYKISVDSGDPEGDHCSQIMEQNFSKSCEPCNYMPAFLNRAFDENVRV